MKKQALTLAIAAALSAPSALAAQDTSGMHYTSASEGFYASIRVRYESGPSKDAKGTFEDSSSRIGVRGTNDLGGGLEGFYQYEWEVDTNNTNRNSATAGDSSRTRVGLVGVRGSFGQVQMGTFWAASNSFVTGISDVANKSSGNFVNTGYRTTQSIEYITPDLNGFQGALRVKANGGGKGDEAVDEWNLAAKYDIKGFTVGATYNNQPEGLAATMETRHLGANGSVGGTGADADRTYPAKKADDLTAWNVGLRYGQDNWYVGGWYGSQDSRSVVVDQTTGAFTDEDQTILSVASGVSLDKVSLYGVWEKRDGNNNGQDGQEDVYTTLGAQYNLGAQSWVWLEYAMRDHDTDPAADNSFNIGLGHSF